jgi:hypothetical protein
MLVALIILGVVFSTKSLRDVHIKELQNVLASEQEIMLDLHVHAINPNIAAITVSQLDINLFAKSKHVRTGSFWRDGDRPRPHHPRIESSDAIATANASEADLGAAGGVDEGTDPMPDPDLQTMLLGRILRFDSPLVFEPSPIYLQPSSSVGEVRLSKPGNRTEEGGSGRWEEVLQHPFELIVRGVINYTPPLSSKPRSANIAGTVMVIPEETLSPDDDDSVPGVRSIAGSGSLEPFMPIA